MPFVSKKQEKWAFATKQPFAKKWADITDQSSLPDKISTPKTSIKKTKLRVKKKQ